MLPRNQQTAGGRQSAIPREMSQGALPTGRSTVNKRKSRSLNRGINQIANYLRGPLRKSLQAGMVNKSGGQDLMRILRMLAQQQNVHKRQAAQRLQRRRRRQGPRSTRRRNTGSPSKQNRILREVVEETGTAAAESLL